MNYFDLNIDKILENWNLSHAVRELIANAMDEALLTGSKTPEITKASGFWVIRDFGRGLKYQDLTQKENAEKLAHPGVVGKFGIGLKDALATFDRHGVRVEISSRHGDISTDRVSKASFKDIVTLHAVVKPPSSPDMVGTECKIYGIDDSHIDAARRMFIGFTEHRKLEKTSFGEIYERSPEGGVIYINGMRVATEPNFLFSYNITSIDAAIKKALNRERQNLGRTAYAGRVKALLLSSKSRHVAEILVEDLQRYSYGEMRDEMTWVDVQQHAVRILNAVKQVVFVDHNQMSEKPAMIENAKSDGLTVVPVPSGIIERIAGTEDISGNRVRDLRTYAEEWNDSFEFTWVDPRSLTEHEQAIWQKQHAIAAMVGGMPSAVREIRISETLKESYDGSCCTIGLWDPGEARIVIRRSSLADLETFAGTLLHEIAHASSGAPDVNRQFERELTNFLGKIAANLMTNKTPESKSSGIFGLFR